MKVCVCIAFFAICLQSSTGSRSLRVRISGDKTARKISFINKTRFRAHGKVRLKDLKQPINDRSFKPLPFPVDYSLYDRNGDARIDIKELVRVTGTAENVQAAFSASDLNGDGFVTEEEYKLKPWGYNPGDVIVNNEEEL
ncbi:uncharacterized protein LOC123529379 [Mercenaria mercenaria]|uniref:uncharacterized protein LOC123529379 n=1 Tax=Mercenaria mercenaria TaxID=6596 RepID=UPI001E1DF8F1|nr:uncharacterized protein LOC123529379 [Mercenaria mercenaria]